MFSVHISNAGGTQAEFTVGSATLALDLALRSQRAGLSWCVEARSEGTVRRLSLASLQELAAALATDDAERHLLHQVQWQHEVQAAFSQN